MTAVLSTHDLKAQLRRAATIQGLRDMAAWLDEHPDVPVPAYHVEILHSLNGDSDEAEAAELRRIAEAAETTADFDQNHPEVLIKFGPVKYRFYMIPEQVQKRHDAWNSYRDSVQVDEVVPV
ncbi:hypothetical protein [Stackebrandtia nassauensis]|uniref:Uncharacterized protein n=1 Tax=Stackebrandtia nassauensis (strain DSM 44728 / CIP 108903 / NRRL B-16338 / NBRC 102104 / LLR-40K-21) TaxID=446470 RepID=D3Q381_STANL|nr:hypothetical protein [Stackebrandtia nassauensis]ADD40051.1 hypothetical protein Snas_0333 [Stackebrandtia nassauensis DSM 44728]